MHLQDRCWDAYKPYQLEIAGIEYRQFPVKLLRLDSIWYGLFDPHSSALQTSYFSCLILWPPLTPLTPSNYALATLETNTVSHDPLLREGEKPFEKLTHKKSFISIFLEELKNETKIGKKK